MNSLIRRLPDEFIFEFIISYWPFQSILINKSMIKSNRLTPETQSELTWRPANE